jgi:hypothetical protein
LTIFIGEPRAGIPFRIIAASGRPIKELANVRWRGTRVADMIDRCRRAERRRPLLKNRH